jgi:hypothetical protein
MVALLDRRRYLSNLVREVNETLGSGPRSQGSATGANSREF